MAVAVELNFVLVEPGPVEPELRFTCDHCNSRQIDARIVQLGVSSLEWDLGPSYVRVAQGIPARTNPSQGFYHSNAFRG
jgi:hypothetical protein